MLLIFSKKEEVSLYNPAAHRELKDQGTFKEDLLTSPNPHLSEGFYPEFTPQDFLKLMTSLFIIALFYCLRKKNTFCLQVHL